tara:strand:- start:198 stop:1250 length:1053 start_codon:yes stop_codon:yes gene_type:complete
MKLIVIIISIFIIYNLNKTLETFNSPPKINGFIRNKDFVEIFFNKNKADTFKPGDNIKYTLFVKEEEKIDESEKKYDGESFIINKNKLKNDWKPYKIECEEITCNYNLQIKNNKTYYFYLVSNLNGVDSNIDKIHTTYNTKNILIYSPDILQIIKNKDSVTLFFKRSHRDTSIPEGPFKYEIFYNKESSINSLHSSNILRTSKSNSPAPSNISPAPSNISPAPSNISPALSIDDKLGIWEKKNYISNYLTYNLKIYGLADEPYHFFIIQNKNGKKSTINNIVRVSDKNPYKPIQFKDVLEEKDYFKLKEETLCNLYSISNCPDELTGTILSKCYKDKELNLCKKSLSLNI